MDKQNPNIVSLQLQRTTIQRLDKVATYLTFKHGKSVSLEKVIKGAIVDYLDLMEPITEEEKLNLKSIVIGPSNDEDFVLYNRFKEIMKRKQIKAVQLHKETGISESNLSQVLNNKNQNMSLDYFLRIWVALDCPPIGDCIYRVQRESV